MAFDAFLKIQGIDGESVTQGFEKWIELISFNWGVVAANSAALAEGRGGSVGRTIPQPFSFTKVTDSSSPAIFAKMTTGTHFDKVFLSCRKAGGSDSGTAPQAFLKIVFTNAVISTYQEGGIAPTDVRPAESISFVYSKIEMQTAPISTDGSLGDFVPGTFDFSAGSGG